MNRSSRVRDAFWMMSDAEKRRADLNDDERILFTNRIELSKEAQCRHDYLLEVRDIALQMVKLKARRNRERWAVPKHLQGKDGEV